GLTQREADVIRLIAQGKTDREIAEELIIAIRTVTTHVGNILNKTGAANRAEAASFATRHGLD
ncbi:MAG: response regulator transcription factor, partial [Chloroflexi bacterium]|nr:response regulator transcription factor [Chloroflexota bacterium]